MTKVNTDYSPFSTGHLDLFFPLYQYQNFGEYLGHMIVNPNVEMRTVIKGIEILGIAMINVIHPGLGEVSTMPSCLMPAHSYGWIKQIKKFLEEAVIKYKLHRLQAMVWENDDVSLNWIEKLGFKKEGLLKNYHPGQNHYMFYKEGLVWQQH